MRIQKNVSLRPKDIDWISSQGEDFNFSGWVSEMISKQQKLDDMKNESKSE